MNLLAAAKQLRADADQTARAMEAVHNDPHTEIEEYSPNSPYGHWIPKNSLSFVPGIKYRIKEKIPLTLEQCKCLIETVIVNLAGNRYFVHSLDMTRNLLNLVELQTPINKTFIPLSYVNPNTLVNWTSEKGIKLYR